MYFDWIKYLKVSQWNVFLKKKLEDVNKEIYM